MPRIRQIPRARTSATALNDDDAWKGTACASACEAIRDELGLDPGFKCEDEWPEFAIDKDVKPDELPDALQDPVKGNTGDMVLVRIPSGSAMGLARAEP